MDDKGCCQNNVLVERLRISVQYEDVYLMAYGRVTAACRAMAAYFDFRNARRRHWSHDRRTPDMVFFTHTTRDESGCLERSIHE